MKIVGTTKKIKLKKMKLTDFNPKKAFMKKQPLFFSGKKLETAIFDRTHLEPGNRISGPALIVDHESTTFLPPSYDLRVDSLLNLSRDCAIL